ncbi:MAG TPA: AbrB/MazE/SpoVT family DNA-binding domain-containing protein [Pseudobdellovibrionaceae bacterium]|jgi:AbrB family looped-hinge helix DNA binding protein
MGALKTSTISKKGQTTIPLEVRESLNLKEGDTVVFIIGNDNEITLKKAPSLEEDLAYLKLIEKTLAPEWMSDDDDDL